MIIARFFLGLIDFFIPGYLKNEVQQRIKAQLVIAMLLVVIPFHIGPIIKFMALNSPAVYVNFAHLVIAVILLALMRVSGNHSAIGLTLLATLYLQEIISIYFTGGFSSNVIGLLLIIPLAGVLLIGYRTGAAFLVLVIAFIVGLYYLTVSGHDFPNYGITESASQIEKYYYAIAVMLAFTLIAAVFQLIKNVGIRSQQEIKDRSQTLSEDLKRLIEQISTNASALTSSAEVLFKTSSEMEQNVDRISLSESKAASSTNESSRSVQDLSTFLKDISKRMRELRKFADLAEEEGQMGSEIITETNAMMTMIEESSQQIKQITLIITDIAEQTNLLSLNAAIEADKAGDYGRGFAVVAEEVGELAERSNDAAQRISELISSSDDNVKAGKEIIEKTGTFLEQIITQVRMIAGEINDLTNVIAEQDISTREVAKGAEEISQKSSKSLKLVNELVTLIKESNSTISSLGETADRLDHQVSSFRQAETLS